MQEYFSEIEVPRHKGYVKHNIGKFERVFGEDDQLLLDLCLKFMKLLDVRGCFHKESKLQCAYEKR